MKIRELLPKITLRFLGGGMLKLATFEKLVFDDDIDVDDSQGDYDPSAHIPKYPLILNLRLIPSSVNRNIEFEYNIDLGKQPLKANFDEFVELFGKESFKTIPESKKKWDRTIILVDDFDRSNKAMPDTNKVINARALGIEAQYVYHDNDNICAYLAKDYPIRIQTDISNGDIYVWYTEKDR